MEFGILGPLAAWRDGRELPLGAPKQRAVLAILILRRNELVPMATLVDELWGERPPATAVKAVQLHVWGLRKALGREAVETRPPGYLLRVEKDGLDAERFEQLLERSRDLLAGGAADEATAALGEALALWRGSALADFRYEPFARNEIGRLEELRLVAVEQRLEAEIALGRHAEAVPELELLARAHPLRESVRRLLMLALYRSGRQADALAAYQNARVALVEELGLDPDESLQRLEQAILRHDPALDLSAAVPQPSREERNETQPGLREQRKTVTVLMARVMGSAELDDSPDPEALTAVVAAGLARAKELVETHGGVHEPLVGNGIMAVFGLPAAHEDDALRALRAAAGIRDGFAELELDGRVGVESGEVFVGGGDQRVTGDAVTISARLEQAAPDGEILVGERAMRLARGAVAAEQLDSLAATGRRKPLPTWRLVSVSAESAPRTFDSPFVGRERELQALRDAWARVRAESRCELVTVLGPAGIGKSRLVAELARGLDASTASGRCLSYGTGITYWPVVDVVRQLRQHLPGVDESVATPLEALLEDAGASSTDELAWAFRKLVEAAAHERPLLLVFEDVQWAQGVLLDLVEHVAFVSSGVPILLVCMSRPDLLDRRPGWRGVIRLDPLTSSEAEQLVRTRFADGDPDPDLARRIVASSGGNPLFVEEMAAMLQESHDQQVTVPPTIHALLAARLDQLDADERTILEAAAVEGEVFHRGALQALAPGESQLTGLLTALVRKDVVRPDRAQLEGEDAFRFRHLLLREAAYDSIPKTTRAGLHERFADWLDRRSGMDAFVGHHLEQAYRCRVEVRTTGIATDELAQRASERLERAATAALGRSDFRAAIDLYRRAASLPPVPVGQRARLLVDLAATLAEAGDLTEAGSTLGDADDLVATAGDEGVRARALVEHQFLELHRAAPGATDGVRSVMKRVVSVFERVGDEHGLCRAWQLQAWSDWNQGHVSAAADGWERAAVHAREAGEEHARADILCWLASSMFAGSVPVDAGIRRCEEIQREVRGHPASEAEVLRRLGGLHGFAGRFELARSLFAARNAACEDLGRGVNSVFSHVEAVVEMLAGDFAAAERGLRTSYEAYEVMGEKALRSTTAAFLARAILAQGRQDDAEHFCKLSEELAEPDDLLTQIVWRGVRARLLASGGRHDEAELLAREAVVLAERTDLLNYRADLLLDLAAVLEAAGRSVDASAVVADALALYEEKGNVVGAATARAHLDVLAAV